jgi:hypothetical protein
VIPLDSRSTGNQRSCSLHRQGSRIGQKKDPCPSSLRWRQKPWLMATAKHGREDRCTGRRKRCTPTQITIWEQSCWGVVNPQRCWHRSTQLPPCHRSTFQCDSMANNQTCQLRSVRDLSLGEAASKADVQDDLVGALGTSMTEDHHTSPQKRLNPTNPMWWQQRSAAPLS